MGTLTDSLLSPDKKAAVVADCVRLIDAEVDAKGGISGLAIRAAYKTVKAVKADVVTRAVESLLPEFAEKLQYFYEEKTAKASGQTFASFLGARAGEVADALLGITDARARRIDKSVVRSAYEKLRPFGKRNVEEAVPRIGELIDKHAPTTNI